MPKLTQADIKAMADDWAAATKLLVKAETAREKALAPLIERHNEEMKAAVGKHDKKIAALTATAYELYFGIMGWLESQPKAVRLAGEKAVAELRVETYTKAGPRVIDVQKFIEKAVSRKKDPWACIKVLVERAEKLLGPEDIGAVSTREETRESKRVASLELK